MEYLDEPLLPSPEQPGELENFVRLMVTDLLTLLTRLLGHGRGKLRRAFELLQIAETLLRRVIYLMALRIDLPAPARSSPVVTRPSGSTASPNGKDRPRKTAAPRFALIEPELPDATRPTDPRPLLRPEECPRVSVLDEYARPYIPPPPPEPRCRARPDTETRFRRRLDALTNALADLDSEARRLAHWIARQKAKGEKRQSPVNLRPIAEDPDRAKADPAWPVLTDIYQVATNALYPDTG